MICLGEHRKYCWPGRFASWRCRRARKYCRSFQLASQRSARHAGQSWQLVWARRAKVCSTPSGIAPSANDPILNCRGATWKPSVTPVGHLNAPSPAMGNVTPVTKTSLAANPQQVCTIGSGHNNQARPFVNGSSKCGKAWTHFFTKHCYPIFRFLRHQSKAL